VCVCAHVQSSEAHLDVQKLRTPLGQAQACSTSSLKIWTMMWTYSSALLHPAPSDQNCQ